MSSSIRVGLWAISTFIPILLTGLALEARGFDDLARVETKADQGIQKYKVSGKGVTVAILDRGIDWSHPDFIRPDGKTRIKWLLDMTGQNQCGGSPAPVEYSEAQINAALAGGPPIDSRDAVGHGTVTAGIAAGNGRAFGNGKYAGMAPEADLIIVKVTSEGAVAHGDQPAETAFNACLETALTWLDGKVTQLGQPVVALINSGTQFGPIDGTSAVSRKIDQVFGLDRPGRVYVAAAGDEGGLKNHAAGNFDNTADTVVQLTRNSTQTTAMQIWYTGAEPAQITVAFDDGTVVGPVGPGAVLDQSGITITHYQPGQEFYPWQSTSGDRAVHIRITGHAVHGSVRIKGATAGAGKFDLYSDVQGPNLSSIVTFDDHLVPGRLTDYSATRSAIVAGAFVARTSYVDIDGITRNIVTEGLTGALYSQSSGGPTRDGRSPGVDVIAPGHHTFAALARNSYWGTLRGNLIQDGGGWYVRGGATSGAAPMVVGAIALMLQLNPSLTARQIKEILHQTSSSDSFTGSTPNIDWGYGKIDVLKALDSVASTSPPLTLANGGATRMSTTGTSANVQVGYAATTINSGLAPYGIAVFSVSQNGVVVSEAGVPASPPTRNARIFIDYRSNVEAGSGSLNINTGFAIANRGNTATMITYTLRDRSGQLVSTGVGNLNAGVHFAKFIHELRDVAGGFTLPANFSTAIGFGSLDIAGSQPFSILALRLTTNQRGETLLTSTPSADFSAALTTTPIYFPQLADGGGYTTTLNLLNTSNASESGTIAIFDDNGAPLVVRETGGTTASTFSYSIPVGGSFVFQTDGSGAGVKIGSVTLTPASGNSAPIGAGVFSFSPADILVTESGIPSARPTTHARIYVDKSGGHDTGIAIANPGGSAANITLQSFQNNGSTPAGNGPASLTVGTGGHAAKFVGQLISGLPDGFTGVLDVSSASPFVALTLRSLSNGRGDFLLTTFPIADATQAAPSPIVFPQIADGGGYSTQFIFISPSGSASLTVNFFAEDGSPLGVPVQP